MCCRRRPPQSYTRPAENPVGGSRPPQTGRFNTTVRDPRRDWARYQPQRRGGVRLLRCAAVGGRHAEDDGGVVVLSLAVLNAEGALEPCSQIKVCVAVGVTQNQLRRYFLSRCPVAVARSVTHPFKNLFLGDHSVRGHATTRMGLGQGWMYAQILASARSKHYFYYPLLQSRRHGPRAPNAE
jgi:hypothetical protein